MKYFKEPLIVFLLLGAGLFGLNKLVSEPVIEEDERVIRITQGDIDNLLALYQKQWKRPPTDQELENLIEALVREQVFYREALAIGLEKDDTIIRRRLVQKMEFIFGDLGTLQEPDESELMAFHEENAERYQSSAKLTFTHVYINPEQHENEIDTFIQEVIDTVAGKLPGDPVIEQLGDRIMLPPSFTNTDVQIVGNRFGSEFPNALMQVETSKWVGPIQSGFGYHIVFVENVQPASTRPMQEVRQSVLNDYQYEKRKEAEVLAYEKLKSNYEIIVESEGSAVE